MCNPEKRRPRSETSSFHVRGAQPVLADDSRSPVNLSIFPVGPGSGRADFFYFGPKKSCP
jgi:hypothetical protein